MELSQLIVQILNTLRFLVRPKGGLGATYDVHLRLIGKRIVNFLLVLIELFSLRVTAIDREIEFYEFFSFLKFTEFYDFFSVEKNS